MSEQNPETPKENKLTVETVHDQQNSEIPPELDVPHLMSTRSTEREDYYVEHEEEHPVATKQEVWSWYMYDFANSIYSNSGIFLSIPLLLTTLSKQSACDEHEIGCDIYADPIGSSQEVTITMGGNCAPLKKEACATPLRTFHYSTHT